MAKIRKQTYTMSMFMEYIKDKDIRDDADVQRASGQWTKEQINELIVTVLTDGYIPPILIGEDLNLQKWLLDGLQRSTSLNMYKYGNYKVTSSIRNSVIPYRTKLTDGDGNIIEKDGDIVWVDAEFDIKNKTYDDLPDELKKQFNSFQIDTVIFEECAMERMSELIQIYNNHSPMNTTQKAFTYISNFARSVRDILDCDFFINYSNYTEKEKTKGVIERVVLESIMCMFHLDNWKKQVKQIGIYLNNNSSKNEFDKLKENLHRLEKIITDDTKEVFNSKDSFVFLTLFSRFTRLNIEDTYFADFLYKFVSEFRISRRNNKGLLFDEIDKDKGTKDKAVIISKLNMLEELMLEYLHIKEDDDVTGDIELFIAENLDMDMSDIKEDMDLYNETLDVLINNTIKDGSKLLHRENRMSLLAMVVYSYKEDVDLDKWMIEYARKNNTYFVDQKKNYLYMKADFEKFVRDEK